ncbi:MAG: hypothetical protein ABIV36_12165 [Sphingobium limneticum]
MSSMLRRMEIRGLKARGYARTPYRIVKDADGQERPVRVERGGLILGPEPDHAPVGYHWPRIVELRKAAVA